MLRLIEMESKKRVTGVTFSHLHSCSNRKVVEDIVSQQVEVIDASISTAHGSGFSSITHELPTNFQINNMDKKDQQTLIYSEILKMYKMPEPQGKGFDNTIIEIANNKTLLYISWVNGMDEKERNDRKKFINACSAAKPKPATNTQRTHK